jgi:hypothetical protein
MIMARKTWMLAVIACGLAFSNVQGADPSPSPPKVPGLMKNKLEAAQKAFKQAWDGLGSDIDIEVAYQWSCRWLDAERALKDKTEERIAALKAHLLRVREIEQVTKRQHEQGLTTLFRVRASEYYVAEAEVWVAQATEQGEGR